MHKVGQRHLQKKLVEAIENCLLDFDHQTFTDLTKRQTVVHFFINKTSTQSILLKS